MPTREIQDGATPGDVLELLRKGNDRFVMGHTTHRNTQAEVAANSGGQNPFAIVLACMDSRVATEMVFDVGLGDLFSIRVAGNIASPQELGSMELGCAVAGTRLIVVLGHRRCEAIAMTVDLLAGQSEVEPGDYEHLASITDPISEAARAETETTLDRTRQNEAFVDRVTELNVRRTLREIREKSRTLRERADSGRIALVGAIYDIDTGRVNFLDSE